MPTRPIGQSFDTIWRFHCDARAARYEIVVEYYSNLPPAAHEKIHDAIRKKALQWFIKEGTDPAEGKIRVKCMRGEAHNGNRSEGEKKSEQSEGALQTESRQDTLRSEQGRQAREETQ